MADEAAAQRESLWVLQAQSGVWSRLERTSIAALHVF